MHVRPPARPHSGGRARAACVLAFWFAALSAPVHAAPRYFTVINDADDDIVALWIAEPGSDRWRRLTDAHGIDASDEQTFDIPVRAPDTCRRDVRFEFKRGAALLHRGLDICRYARYRPGPQRRRAARFGTD